MSTNYIILNGHKTPFTQLHAQDLERILHGLYEHVSDMLYESACDEGSPHSLRMGEIERRVPIINRKIRQIRSELTKRGSL